MNNKRFLENTLTEKKNTEPKIEDEVHKINKENKEITCQIEERKDFGQARQLQGKRGNNKDVRETV